MMENQLFLEVIYANLRFENEIIAYEEMKVCLKIHTRYLQMINQIISYAKINGKEHKELFSMYTWLWSGSEIQKDLCRKRILNIAFDETIHIEIGISDEI